MRSESLDMLYLNNIIKNRLVSEKPQGGLGLRVSYDTALFY